MIYVTQCSAYATKRIKYPGINLPKETKEVTVSVHMCCPSLSLPPPIHCHPPRLLQSPSLSSLSHRENPIGHPKELYIENYKTLMKEIIDNIKGWRVIPCPGLEESILLKLLYYQKQSTDSMKSV